VSFDAALLEAAHEHCFGNEVEVCASECACCIACAIAFPAKLVRETAPQRGSDGPTVFCPVCAFDTVVGDRSGYPVDDPEFITAMNRKYFKEPLGSDESWKELLDA
jgi:hypothetical protein